MPSQPVRGRHPQVAERLEVLHEPRQFVILRRKNNVQVGLNHEANFQNMIDLPALRLVSRKKKV